MIRFHKNDGELLLEYKPDGPLDWIWDRFRDHGLAMIKKTYHFARDDIYFDEEHEPGESVEEVVNETQTVTFRFARLENNYYVIPARILGTRHDVHIWKEFRFNHRAFSAERDISIFPKIDKQVDESIWIGNDEQGKISVTRFESLLSSFPNSYELTRYSEARINSFVQDCFETAVDYTVAFERYLDKKPSHSGEDLLSTLSEFESSKYSHILSKLDRMLEAQDSYNEKQWQKEILQIIVLLYPKYIRVLEEVTVPDANTGSSRRLDFLLVDSSGHVDVVEIKRPKLTNMMSSNVYRDNHVPSKEVSGTVMQVEKYLYHLNKWGHTGEQKLTDRFRQDLPDGVSIRIVNPTGVVIMGRTEAMSERQIRDLEFVRRKYKNVVDIVTYDDLADRLRLLVQKFSVKE